VTCETGHLWITEKTSPTYARGGQRVALVGEGLAVLEAKGDARLRID
jgi:hypothetical protein